MVSSAVPAATTRTTSFKGSSPSSKYVKLNVGGALYYTTMQTLTKQDTMLKAMFSGRMEVLTDSEGKYNAISAGGLDVLQPHIFVDLCQAPSLTLDLGSLCRLDSDRQVWEALWNHPELLEGRRRPVTREPEGDRGVAGRGEILFGAGSGGRMSSSFTGRKLKHTHSPYRVEWCYFQVG